jgi:carboxyl-terminal processing protease
VHALSDGSGVAITTQKYLTAGGHDIHKKGVEPDIKVELPKVDVDKNGVPNAQQLKNFKDTQLERAKAVVKSMIAKVKTG